MHQKIERLLRYGSEALSPESGSPRGVADDLNRLIGRRNGFFVFAQALLVLPVSKPADPQVPTLVSWNDPEGWRKAYPGLNAEDIYFAMDIFGGQFGIAPNGVVHVLEPETGEKTHVADSLGSWAGWLLDDAETRTGYPLAEQWQKEFGRLGLGYRLVPRLPFVAGGEFAITNLVPMSAERALRTYAGLTASIRDVPDGATIRWAVTE